MRSCPRAADGPTCLLGDLAVAVLSLYRLILSPVLRWRGVTCLHYPTCSEFGILAFRKYSFGKACKVTLDRWRSCHPHSGKPYIDYP
jgi:putative component of membrane protein insertase Oxa1/YidC/SpoIIIJ protein YidD